MKISLITLFYVVGLASLGQAQDKITQAPKATRDTTEQMTTNLQGFSYFHPDDKTKLYVETDTSIQHEYTRFDPTKRRGNEHVTLGNTFSAASPLLFLPNINIRFATGYTQYDPYRFQFSNARFYIAKRPQSEVFFSQFSNQLNFSAGAKVAIPFRKGWSFSLDYFRVSEKGFYPSHAIKSTNLSTGLLYSGKGERYQALLSFHHHAHDEENNGGVIDPNQVTQGVPGAGVSTFLNGAKTRHQKRGFSLVQYFTLAGNDQWKLYIKNTLLLEPSYAKFSHATTSKDTQYYGSFLTDTRGIRRYLDVRHGLADFVVHGENKKGIRGKLGIRYDQFNIEDQGFQKVRSDLTLHAQGVIPVFKIFELRTKAELGLGQNAGNFLAEGSLEIQLKRWATLDGGIRLFVSEPTYAQQNLVLNQSRVFLADYLKSFGTRIFGNLTIKPTKTSVQFAQSLLSNPVYWVRSLATDGQVNISSVQAEQVLSYTLLGIKQDLKFYTIDFNHAIFFQVFSDNLYHLPPWYSVHQLYWNLSIFKKAMKLSLGGEARFIPNYSGIGYSPLHGQFFSDDTAEFPLVPDVDLVLNAKVKTFRISIMIENAGQWFANQPNYDVSLYPRLNPLLRFSVRWMFYN